jgi:D-glycero-D-manno-heptose 1,7-bisphosphate phosphatase
VSAGAGRADPRRAVFLDRDGTLLDELGYLGDPARVRLIPGTARALRRLRAADLSLVVVTNQSGVARGLFDQAALDAVHARMAELLAAEGVTLDAVLACPHHPELGQGPYRVECACRKPAPGLLLEGARRVGAELARSFVVGDSLRDLEAGERAGVPVRILLGTGKGRAARGELEAHGAACRFAADLEGAADAILAELAQGR